MRNWPSRKNQRKLLKFKEPGTPLSLKAAFEDIERISKRVKLPKHVNIKSLIETGRV